MEGLIKEGASAAEISVIIYNGSTLEPAFKFSDYGEYICIDRILKRDGQHVFRIKNGITNKVVETRKEEVLAICDHYSLLVDNPLVILTQETSKKFLVNSTPKDLYAVRITFDL